MGNKKQRVIPAHYSWNSSIITRGVIDPIKRKLGWVDENERPVSLKESATGQELDRMKDTAKGAGKLAATGFAFGNPITASAAMAPLITGSQAYFMTEGLKDAYNRVTSPNKTAADGAMVALDVAGAVPAVGAITKGAKYVLPTVAKTVINKPSTIRYSLDNFQIDGGSELLAPGVPQVKAALKGVVDAEKLANSETLLNSAKRTADQYNRFNSIYKIQKREISPTILSNKNPILKMVDTFESTGNGPTKNIDNVGGMYKKMGNEVLIRRNKVPMSKELVEGIGFHEGLHSIGYGEGPQNYWKAKYLFGDNYNEIPEYFKNGYETAVHSLTYGRKLGITPGTPYPGDAEFLRMLENHGISGAPYYFKRDTPKARRRFWEALSGEFFKQGGILKRK